MKSKAGPSLAIALLVSFALVACGGGGGLLLPLIHRRGQPIIPYLPTG